MNQGDKVDTLEKAYKLGSVMEKSVSDPALAVAIFEKLETPFKWGFIQGQLETHGKIVMEQPIRVIFNSKMMDLLVVMAGFTKIPHLFGCSNVFYDDINATDLLGEIYRNGRATNNDIFYKQYMSILSPVGDCLVYKTCPEAITPSKSRISDVGYDLSIIKKVKTLNQVVALYDTGIKVRVPHGYYTEIVPRSSLSKSGYILANSVGIIDRSYNGNLYVALAKIDVSAPEIKFPFRCCQLIFKKQYHVMMKETDHDLEATARGEGGFGSTG